MSEMSKPEKNARALIAGESLALSQMRDLLYKQDRKTISPIFFALRLLWKAGDHNKHIGDLAWEGLRYITIQDTQDPVILADLITLLTLYQSETLSGAVRKIYPGSDTGPATLVMALALNLRNICVIQADWQKERVRIDSIARAELLTLQLLEPLCEMGYTYDQIKQILGDETKIQRFIKFMDGQTVGACPCTKYNDETKTYIATSCKHPAQPIQTIYYSEDLLRFIKGLPVID